MRLYNLLIYSFCFLLSGTVLGQQKANYKLADKYLVSKMGGVVFSREVKPNYLPDSEQFWYSDKTSRGNNYYIVNPKSKKQQLLFDSEDMAARVSEITNKTFNTRDLNITPNFAEDGKSFSFMVQGVTIKYDRVSGQCSELPRPEVKSTDRKVYNRLALMYSYAPDSSYAVFSRGHNIWLRKGDEPDSLARRITDDGMENFSYSDNEVGEAVDIFTAKARWLKGTRRLFVIREDNRGIGTLLVVSSAGGGRPRLVTPVSGSGKYTMPGDKKVTQYELSLIDAETGKVTKVALEKWKDQKVKLLYVSKDSRYLYVQRTRRTCDELDICKVNTETGEVTVVLNEVCKPYFSDRYQSITFLNGDREFIWWSERTGWGHYYLYSADGQYRGAITSGNWMAEKIVRLDTNRRELYVTGHGREKGMNPYYACLYKAVLDGNGRVELLTPEDANHNVVMSPSGNYFVDNYSRVDLAPRSVLRDKNGKLICDLAEADLSALYAMGWKMPERFTVKAADGVTDLYGVMWKPFDFDSTRHYPIISYVYPGPQQEAMDLNFTATGNHNAALAQVGFIVVNMGHRGGRPLRDKYYRTYGYGNLRDYALADDKHGLEQLAARHSFIDINRVGIFGHSGGGFMSAAAICTYPEFYKAAVASSGNHDNNMYNQAWGETFHGVTQTVKGKDTVFTCKVPTNMELVKNLKGHLLVVTGDEDDNVHPGHTLRLVDALLKAGKNFDMYVLPGQKHLYRGAADLFWRRKIWFHFAKHLLGDYSSENFTEMDEYNQ